MTRTRLAIGVATRERPVMFATLAASLAAQVPPAGTDLLYIVCENGFPGQAVRTRVAELAAATGRPSLYLNEPRLGIPFARNAVLDRALALGATHLAFIDDDETAPPAWIGRLYAGMIAGDAGLVGGPVVYAVDPDLRLDRWQRLVAKGIVAAQGKRNAGTRSRWAAGRGDRITIATNNWLCDLAVLRAAGLRFREEIGLGGGSDTAFLHDFRACGGRTAWVPDAPVRENLPPSRLRPGYIVARAKSQAAAEWTRRRRAGADANGLRGSVYGVNRLAVGLIGTAVGSLVAAALFYRGLVALGQGLGRLSAIRKGQSAIQLYATVHGD